MVIQRTVMSPYAGGPVYQWIRHSFVSLRRDVLRRPQRWLDRNWCMERNFAVGVPELHLDPHKNGWRYYVDSSWYAGMIDKTFEDSIRGFWMYPLMAFLIMYQHHRWCENNKYEVFSKWRK